MRAPEGAVAGLAVVLCLAVAALGAARLKPQESYDGPAFIRYAQVLKDTGRLPSESQSYEYASPPAYLWASVQLQRIGDALRGPWAIVLAAVAVLGVAGFALRRRLGLLVVAAVAGGLAVDAAVSRADWRPGQLLSLAWTAGLLAVAWLLARELWPGRPRVQALAVALTAGVPIVIRLGTMFHPEMQLAFLAVLALFLTIRGRRLGWPLAYGAALGATIGLGALTRQTAVVVAAAIAFVVLADGRRRALPFLAVAGLAIVLVAGPWWGWQAYVYGNPLQSNLDRYLLPGGQPLSFYLSAPLRTLVVHPYRPDFAGQLWPQFHADLWSDWFGVQHAFFGTPPGDGTRVFLSSQSVLGLLATPLALGGLLAFGGAGLDRVVRRAASQRDLVFALFLVVAVASWAAFVTQLVRFPQQGGDPIKSSYMLYLSPIFAISGLAAARWLWCRGAGWRYALTAWAALYAVSYAGFLATSWPVR